MRQIYYYSMLLLCPLMTLAQEVKLKVSPYVNATTSIKEGLIEAGPELNWEKVADGKTFTLRPSIRLPLTNEAENVLQIDRFTSTWKSVLAAQFTKDNTQESGGISRHSFTGQFEYGHAKFTYYPGGDQSFSISNGKNSYAFEIKYAGFFSKGQSGAAQFSPQFRLRYARDWQAASEVSVLNTPSPGGFTTVSDLIVDPPSVRPVFSPAFSLQIYPGKGNFSYSPTIYYDFTGNSSDNGPFGSLNRLRLESWIFFYPSVTDSPNVKIGISPFLSLRTKGTDSFNKAEYGGMITLKFGTSFLQFL
ncbi:hypothetical protein [Dyadobacter fanqingshengii]|uniref:DUF3078 domain-containing protein n=1 Tax=Dyadobacter fanqingshengii TaxID=2906443 RepID=A0A9X1TCV2_9BACT|nr:hypothetical protein [Dyadobacter fanqingshengii]MCF0043519.1 hypothetical protein [Dyadobacter fanqingshengii]USJ34862.1 hypothetical protein NFI81_19385 [Dyadobacter fanqingshengii]